MTSCALVVFGSAAVLGHVTTGTFRADSGPLQCLFLHGRQTRNGRRDPFSRSGKEDVRYVTEKFAFPHLTSFDNLEVPCPHAHI